MLKHIFAQQEISFGDDAVVTGKMGKVYVA
jgi:hypothetical protein